MNAVPMPEPDAIPVNDPESIRLGPGERVTFKWVPKQRQTPGFLLPALYASKEPEMVYRVWLDGDLTFGPAAVPPADIDRGGSTFMPAYEFDSELKVQVTNTSAETTRNVSVQPVGWERSRGGDGGA